MNEAHPQASESLAAMAKKRKAHELAGFLLSVGFLMNHARDLRDALYEKSDHRRIGWSYGMFRQRAEELLDDPWLSRVQREAVRLVIADEVEHISVVARKAKEKT